MFCNYVYAFEKREFYADFTSKPIINSKEKNMQETKCNHRTWYGLPMNNNFSII